jgi:hypothetical protein
LIVAAQDRYSDNRPSSFSDTIQARRRRVPRCGGFSFSCSEGNQSRFDPTTRQSDHEFDSGSNPKFLVDRVQMNFDSALSHAQFVGNFPVGKSITDQRYDFLLASTQLGKWFRDI